MQGNTLFKYLIEVYNPNSIINENNTNIQHHSLQLIITKHSTKEKMSIVNQS